MIGFCMQWRSGGKTTRGKSIQGYPEKTSQHRIILILKLCFEIDSVVIS